MALCTQIPLSAPYGPENVFLDTWCVCNGQCKKIPGFSVVVLCTHTHTHPHLCTPWPEKLFLDTWDGCVCNAQCRTKTGNFWAGAPHTHTSAYHGPEKVFLDTSDGCVCNGQCKKMMRVFRVALRAHIPLHTMGHKSCFWIPGMGVFAMGNAKNYWVFLGLRSIHTYLSLHTMGQKRCS